MTGARSEILGRVREAIIAKRRAGPAAQPIQDHIRPGRAQGEHRALITRFLDMALFAGATVATLADDVGVPSELARYLSRENLGDNLILSPSLSGRQMPWKETPRLSVRQAPFGPEDRVAVTGAVAGIAETGTLLVRSGAKSPNAFHLLPVAHVAVLDSSAIVGSYEDALERLGKADPWPRAATFITGPSRTADIEKTPQIGVHGPRKLHIVLIDGEKDT